MTKDKLQEILTLHIAWLKGQPNGIKADLSRANLSGAYLYGANLFGADLSGLIFQKQFMRIKENLSFHLISIQHCGLV